MFTGLVAGVGAVAGYRSRGRGMRLTIDTRGVVGHVAAGDSIAVDGVCLTAAAVDHGCVTFDVSTETLGRTTIPAYRRGREVNLERALRVGDALGGHVVSGHIDGLGQVRRVERRGEFRQLDVIIPASLSGGIVPKGSVALDGVSLTVAGMSAGRLRLAVIPETLRRTTIGQWREGRKVNVEIDKAGAVPSGRKGGLTREYLEGHGFS